MQWGVYRHEHMRVMHILSLLLYSYLGARLSSVRSLLKNTEVKYVISSISQMILLHTHMQTYMQTHGE